MAGITTNRRNGTRTIQFQLRGKPRQYIRLGKMSSRHANAIKDRIESLVGSKEAGFSPDPEVLDWLTKAGDKLCDRIAKVGLMPYRSSVNLGPFLKAYIDGRTDISAGSIRNMGQAARYLKEHFGESKPLRAIGITDAEAFAIKMKSEFAEATAARVIKYARQFWDYAVRARHVPEDIWDHIKAGKMDNQERQVFIDKPTIMRVIDACPDAEWRLIVALSRFGGVRVPSEVYVLTWDDILWDTNRFVVRAPKTGTRVVPIFPELRPFLQECFDRAQENAVHVIVKHRNKSLRTRMDKIVMRAGLAPWEKTFQNLRSSRQTELSDEFPEHVVCKWLGNSKAVARAHYEQVTESHFDRASAPKSAPFLADIGSDTHGSIEHVGAPNAGKMQESKDLRGSAEGGDYARRESNPPQSGTVNSIISSDQAKAAHLKAHPVPYILNPFEPLIDEQTLLALEIRAFMEGDIE